MNMYILSAAQFDQIIKALDDARFALDTCQHIELDIADPAEYDAWVEERRRAYFG